MRTLKRHWRLKMNTKANKYAMLLACGLTSLAVAGETNSSASASSNGRRPGQAVATAEYNGNGVGFARTDTRSGNVNFARGFSVGFDRDGLSLSHSFAVAGRNGPAVGSTLNMHIGLDGRGQVSTGQVIADGDRNRSVTVAGGSSRRVNSSQAYSTANGKTGRYGEVKATTQTRAIGPRQSMRAVRESSIQRSSYGKRISEERKPRSIRRRR